jgi:ribonucleoside-diphosphate reductase alpha chain
MMGIAEWFATRDIPYGPDETFEQWLIAWARSSDGAADYWSSKLGLSTPVAVRAIAPNGSTSIAGGQTTGGIEPIFAKAYQRRYLSEEGWKAQYVVDSVAERLYKRGVDIESVDDAYSLSHDVERRIAFQAFVQQYVDNAISSTINLPPYGEEGNNDETAFGETLYKYLPKLRGVTVYPDGARSGQPLVKVPFKEAMAKKDVVFEMEEQCNPNEGICGI